MHGATFHAVKPTEAQMQQLGRLADAAKAFCEVLEAELPAGPDKTFVIRNFRTTMMWSNIAITREHNGAPRETHDD